MSNFPSIYSRKIGQGQSLYFEAFMMRKVSVLTCLELPTFGIFQTNPLIY